MEAKARLMHQSEVVNNDGSPALVRRLLVTGGDGVEQDFLINLIPDGGYVRSEEQVAQAALDTLREHGWIPHAEQGEHFILPSVQLALMNGDEVSLSVDPGRNSGGE